MNIPVILPIIAMVAMLIIGVPIPFSLGIAGIIGIILVTGDLNILIGAMGIAPYSTVADYMFTTIPMFILMAYLIAEGGLARALYEAASTWVSHIRGGLAIATVFVCTIFGAMSGSSSAAASVMSKIAMPNMRRFGYSEILASGTIGIGSTLPIFIPPSTGIIVYGIVTETSIGKLLIAGIIPGLVLAALLILCILTWVTISPNHAPRAQQATWNERWKKSVKVWPSFLLIMLIMVLLYTGIATPTEVGAIGAFMAALIGLTAGSLTMGGIIGALKETMWTTTMVFLIIIGANIFGVFLTMSQVPQQITSAVIAMDLNRWIVIVGIVVIYFVISMFMDEIPLMLITLQLTFPLIISLGFDPIWYGIMSMIMVAMGLVFPPVGMIAFVIAGTAKINLINVYKGTSILMIAIIITAILLMIFPGMALWLPSTMY